MKKVERFMRDLPVEFTDRSLIILKGHLLLEVALKDYISKRVNFPDRMGEGKVNFSSLVLFASTLEDRERDRWLWKALKMANKIRNQVAHSLDDQKLTKIEKEFVDYVKIHDGEFTVEVNGNDLPYRPLSLIFMQLYERIAGSMPPESDPVKKSEKDKIAEKMIAALKEVADCDE